MLNTRIIPCLQLVGESLVKTTKFNNYKYIGDPINTVRIFNELEVDELCFVDIRATLQKREPNFKILSQISSECFMPLSYGGGIKSFDDAKKIFSIGFEKIVINNSAICNPKLITEIANYSGSQSIIISVDIKRNMFGNYSIYSNNGTKKISLKLIYWIKMLEDLGAGELLVTSIDRDGTWEGFDIEIMKKISDSVNIPVIANGGAGDISHISKIINETDISAVCLGSMVVFQKKDMGVLINFPDKHKLDELLSTSKKGIN